MTVPPAPVSDVLRLPTARAGRGAAQESAGAAEEVHEPPSTWPTVLASSRAPAGTRVRAAPAGSSTLEVSSGTDGASPGSPGGSVGSGVVVSGAGVDRVEPAMTADRVVGDVLALGTAVLFSSPPPHPVSQTVKSNARPTAGAVRNRRPVEVEEKAVDTWLVCLSRPVRRSPTRSPRCRCVARPRPQ